MPHCVLTPRGVLGRAGQSGQRGSASGFRGKPQGGFAEGDAQGGAGKVSERGAPAGFGGHMRRVFRGGERSSSRAGSSWDAQAGLRRDAQSGCRVGSERDAHGGHERTSSRVEGDLPAARVRPLERLAHHHLVRPLRGVARHQVISAALKASGVAFTSHAHPAVITAEEQEVHIGGLPGAHVKSLLVADKKHGTFLITVLNSRRVDMKAVAKELGLAGANLRFCDKDALKATLGVEQGALSPFALINDTEGKVTFVLDQGVLKHDTVLAHPLVNTATLSLSTSAMLDFVKVITFSSHQ
ncbi:YbaK/aminoacyl-tRNA synthetase-associated domain-containing protein [Pavlovales sp. CCMP2436]|nr:YbaK/aminoacyl-tRNA synthetase-associated domain-containing protein [Pavlovales sp. CCMP2436]